MMIAPVAYSLVVVWLAVCSCQVFAATTEQWKSRTVYQIMTDRFATSDNNYSTTCSDLNTYCGGTWRGIINHLDYLDELGVDAIWISPVVDSVDRGYHGYWARNLYELNSKFGNESDLQELVKEVHKRDMYIMFDVVANHMGPSFISGFNPFNKLEHYHPFCMIDWTNETSRFSCRVGDDIKYSLPDLKTESSFVTTTLNSWIANLTSHYNIDGLRMDAGKHITPSWWAGLVNAAGVFSTCEVYSPGYDDDMVRWIHDGKFPSIHNFQMWSIITSVFLNGDSVKKLQTNIVDQSSIYSDPWAMLNFVENHDNTRILSTFANGTTRKGVTTLDKSLVKNAYAYLLTTVGIPTIYYGVEQDFIGVYDDAVQSRLPLWSSKFDTTGATFKWLRTINKMRKNAGSEFHSANVTSLASQDKIHVFSRGPVLVVVTNVGSDVASPTVSVTSPWDDGTELVNIHDTTQKITASGGKFSVQSADGAPIIYYVSSKYKSS